MTPNAEIFLEGNRDAERAGYEILWRETTEARWSRRQNRRSERRRAARVSGRPAGSLERGGRAPALPLSSTRRKSLFGPLFGLHRQPLLRGAERREEREEEHRRSGRRRRAPPARLRLDGGAARDAAAGDDSVRAPGQVGHRMNLTVLDWAIVFAYFALSIGIGFAFTKKGGESLEEYFVAGRKVPWWLAGAAMIATTFAADTPLVVTGLVAAHGVAGNWIWWNFVMSGTLTVFLYARLWRRAKVMTDVEFAEIRYSGRPATFLRGFRALYLALPINLIILGWVTLAMVKILQISLGIRPLWAVGLCFVITVGLLGRGGDVGRPVDRPRPARHQDDGRHPPRVLRREEGRRHRRARGRPREALRLRRRRDLVPPARGLGVDARDRALHVPRRPVVGRVVPRRRAGRRRLRRAADLLGEDRARRHPRDALLQRRPLRAPALAVDPHGPRDRPPLPGRRPRERQAGPRGRVRPGDGRPHARGLEGLHARGLRGGVHVDGRDPL